MMGGIWMMWFWVGLAVVLSTLWLVGNRRLKRQEVTGGADAGGQSREPREPSLEPKHRIFLSHSGVQKDFTWQLCEDLERVQYYPFFDRHVDSLPKGEKFPPLILEAAKQCLLAVLVLSDEFFTRSKWPMMELCEFVTAQGSNNPSLKILPLFLGITMKQYHEKKRQACWFKKWDEFARKDERIDVKKWKEALSKIPGGINAMEYIGVGEGEVAFRKKVVEAICQLLPPDVKYDVSHVQSLAQLCDPIKKKLQEVEVPSKFKVKVVGLYGMGGVGKTTISRAICNQMFEGFSGKVCHVELGSDDQAELKKRILRELTDANAMILENNSKKLDYLLKQRMGRQKVFLVLDNAWDAQVEEVMKYLCVGFHAQSMVFVTSRSLEVLKRLDIEERNCMEMPTLEEDGAIDVFLHYLGVSRESIKGKREWESVQRCIMECCFSKGKKISRRSKDKRAYHPLALKVLGCQLQGMKIRNWDETLRKLEVVQDKFNMLKDKVHPVYSILCLGFDNLRPEQKDIFMDLALIWKPTWTEYFLFGGVRMEWEWLCVLHSQSEVKMIAHGKALQRKGLLDKVNDMTKMECNIHDLYFEYAEAEARARPFEERRILFDKDGSDVPRELQMYPAHGVWACLKRLIIYKSKVKSLQNANLHHCKNVEVLLLAHCLQLEEVDVTGMSNLRFLAVYRCEKLHKLTGLETLRRLVAFCCAQEFIRVPFAKFAPNEFAISSVELRVVRLIVIADWLSGDKFPVDLKGCTTLQEVTLLHDIYGKKSVRLAPTDFGKHLPQSLLKLNLSWYPYLGSSPISAMTALTNLQDLKLSACKGIRDLTGLCGLISLQKLDVSNTEIFEVPSSLWKLKHLQYLNVENCNKLTSIVAIAHATTLQTIVASDCGELREVPNDFKSLQHLEVLDFRNNSSMCTLPEDYERLTSYPESEGKLKVKVQGCWGLIAPLVRKLRVSVVSEVACEDGCNCGGESMASWVEARKNFDVAAYGWLKDVLGNNNDEDNNMWTYLLDDGSDEVIDVVIRGLCEHDVCGSGATNRLAAVVQEVGLKYDFIDEKYLQWWVVVATAPCTFKAITEGAMVEPWRKTLLHYTIVSILPSFLKSRKKMIKHKKMIRRKKKSIQGDDDEADRSNSWFLETWCYKAIVAILQKCREKLDRAGEQGTDSILCDEGKRFVNTFLGEIEAAKSEVLHDDSILGFSKDALSSADKNIVRYKKLFPNYKFECTLATQIVHLGTDEDILNLSEDELEDGEEGVEKVFNFSAFMKKYRETRDVDL